MFDTEVVVSELDARECVDAIHDSVLAERWVGAQRLAHAAHFADLRHPDTEVDETLTKQQRISARVRVPVGAQGTPVVSEFAILELAVARQTTVGSARALLRDALELRHRMPCLWRAVMTGHVEDWKARQVARLTHVLSEAQCARVDAEVLEALVGLPYGRALAVIEGKVIAADPEGHESRRKAEQERRYVALGRRTSAGVQTLFARGAVGDMTRLMAMVNHLAEKLAEAGDESTADERRAKALGLLANPALACVVLAQHATPAETPNETQDSDDGRTVVHDAVDTGRALLEQGGDEVVQRLRPTSVMHLHAHVDTVRDGEGVVRVEGLGAISTTQVREWLQHDRVTVRPVAYPLEVAGVDSYEISRPLSEAARLLQSFEVFPWGTVASRGADLDHNEAWRRRHRRRGDPPQTRLDNLGPLGRSAHRAKTFGGFEVHQTSRGCYYWRVPTGRWYRVDRAGTTALGHEMPREVERLVAPTKSAAEYHLDLVWLDAS